LKVENGFEGVMRLCYDMAKEASSVRVIWKSGDKNCLKRFSGN
jgi:hypothetical protein